MVSFDSSRESATSNITISKAGLLRDNATLKLQLILCVNIMCVTGEMVIDEQSDLSSLPGGAHGTYGRHALYGLDRIFMRVLFLRVSLIN